MSERQNVEIDYCPTCRGVWLDRGELDKIIERVVADTPSPGGAPPPRRDDDRRSDDRRYEERRYEEPKKKKKTSFLQDLFEFGGE
jgi:Zn-finger nucleic acid-binding protein